MWFTNKIVSFISDIVCLFIVIIWFNKSALVQVMTAHWGSLTQIIITELVHHRFVYWLVTCLVPNHYMHPRCLAVILHWTKNVNKFEFLFWKLKAALWYLLQINISATNCTEVKMSWIENTDGSMQNWCISIVNTLELPQYCTKPLEWSIRKKNCKWNLILTVQTLSFKSPIMHWAWVMTWNVINSLRPSDAIWWQRSGSTLAQVPDSTKPLPEPMLTYHQ